MKKKSIIISVVAVILIAAAAVLLYRGYADKVRKTEILDRVYEETVEALAVYVDIYTVTDDVVSYQIAFAEEHTYKNLTDLTVALDCALKKLDRIDTDVFSLTDSELKDAASIGVDVSGLALFCKEMLESQLNSEKISMTTRSSDVDLCIYETGAAKIASISSSDKKLAELQPEYLYNFVQTLWADFEWYGAEEKYRADFPELFEGLTDWCSDKEILFSENERWLAEYEEINVDLNRIIGQSEAELELMPQTMLFAPYVFADAPAFVSVPAFASEATAETVYFDADGNELSDVSITEAVAKAKKSRTVYTDVSFEESALYLNTVMSQGCTVKDYREDENGEHIVFESEGGELSLTVKDGTVTLEIEDVRKLSAVPYLYVSNLNTADMDKAVFTLWEKAASVYSERFAIAEKMNGYLKAYVEAPTAENLKALQIMYDLGVKELSGLVTPDTALSDGLKEWLVHPQSYDRAVSTLSTVDKQFSSCTEARIFLIEETVFNQAYLTAGENILAGFCDAQAGIIEQCRALVGQSFKVAAQNLGAFQAQDFLTYLNGKYPLVVTDDVLDCGEPYEDIRTQRLSNINWIYDRLSEALGAISDINDDFAEYFEGFKAVMQKDALEKEHFTTPEGLTADNALPWVLSYAYMKREYQLTEEGMSKPYSELTPDDVASYSLIFEDVTYEDAVAGIDRYKSKDVSVTEGLGSEAEGKQSWSIDKNGRTVLYEWTDGKVTMTFPDCSIALTAFGWYHYFR